MASLDACGPVAPHAPFLFFEKAVGSWGAGSFFLLPEGGREGAWLSSWLRSLCSTRPLTLDTGVSRAEGCLYACEALEACCWGC